MFRLAQRCIIIQATTINVGQLNRDWFVSKAGLFELEELGAGSVFTPAVAVAKTSAIQIVVQPPNIQFYPQGAEENDEKTLLGCVPKFATVLGVGNLANITSRLMWHMCEKSYNTSAAELSRKLFSRPNPIESSFPSDSSEFGFVSQKTDEDGTITSLDVRPLNIVDAKGPHQHLQVTVNFFSSYEANNLMTITDAHTKRWLEFRKSADNIIKNLEEAAKA